MNMKHRSILIGHQFQLRPYQIQHHRLNIFKMTGKQRIVFEHFRSNF